MIKGGHKIVGCKIEGLLYCALWINDNCHHISVFTTYATKLSVCSFNS